LGEKDYDLLPKGVKSFWTIVGDIEGFSYTTFFFSLGKSYEKKEWAEKIETRMGISGLLMSEKNIVMNNLIYQKNYPKGTGSAKDKLLERITVLPKDYAVLGPTDKMYFSFRNIGAEKMTMGFEILERGMPLGLKIMIPVVCVTFPGILALIAYCFFWDGGNFSFID
jgi:hypothetical protein